MERVTRIELALSAWEAWVLGRGLLGSTAAERAPGLTDRRPGPRRSPWFPARVWHGIGRPICTSALSHGLLVGGRSS